MGSLSTKIANLLFFTDLDYLYVTLFNVKWNLHFTDVI